VVELLLDARPVHLVYHIENPARQPWGELLNQLSEHIGLGTPASTVEYNEWLARVQAAQDSHLAPNPSKALVDFFEKDFQRMSCGGIVLDTAITRKISSSLRSATPVDSKTIARYISNWRQLGFLDDIQ
jgi:hypothetical protein